jgi:hypothetical protein
MASEQPNRRAGDAAAGRATFSGENLSSENSRTLERAQALRADLIGSSTCTAAGFRATGNALILALCRRLLAAGLNPAQAMEVYRGAMLALRVRSIRDGAKLTVAEGDHDAPRFRPWKPAPCREGSPYKRNSAPAASEGWIYWPATTDGRSA